jgi:hypothetical protein
MDQKRVDNRLQAGGLSRDRAHIKLCATCYSGNHTGILLRVGSSHAGRRPVAVHVITRVTHLPRFHVSTVITNKNLGSRRRHPFFLNDVAGRK